MCLQYSDPSLPPSLPPSAYAGRGCGEGVEAAPLQTSPVLQEVLCQTVQPEQSLCEGECKQEATGIELPTSLLKLRGHLSLDISGFTGPAEESCHY